MSNVLRAVLLFGAAIWGGALVASFTLPFSRSDFPWLWAIAALAIGMGLAALAPWKDRP